MKLLDIMKRTTTVPIEDIKKLFDAYGGEWVYLVDTDEMINIVDNGNFKEFEGVKYLEDDRDWQQAQMQYLRRAELREFQNYEDLNKYIAKLTKRKYG